jgi:hypothetical protein
LVEPPAQATVPALLEGSPPDQMPNLTCIGVCGYWLASAPAAVRTRTVWPLICQTIWSAFHSMV